MISFIFDTSALLSLESASLLDIIFTNFKLITTSSVLRELEEFASYNDALGNIAREVLKKKTRIAIENLPFLEELPFVSKTDNELFNLAKSKQLFLITDDLKLRRHCSGKIVTDFSTIFLLIFVDSRLLTKTEALDKLEQMRIVRNWQDNIIYISTKEILENIEN